MTAFSLSGYSILLILILSEAALRFFNGCLGSTSLPLKISLVRRYSYFNLHKFLCSRLWSTSIDLATRIHSLLPDYCKPATERMHRQRLNGKEIDGKSEWSPPLFESPFSIELGHKIFPSPDDGICAVPRMQD